MYWTYYDSPERIPVTSDDVVFWYDEKQEFLLEIEGLGLENAKLLILREDELFKTKMLLEREDKETNYLIYAPFKRPKNKENHLADTIMYSKVFLKKASSIWKNIWYIDGNHEYYFQEKDNGDNRLYKLIEDLKDYPNIKYVANTVQEIQCKEKLLKIGFLPIMYNMNNPEVLNMFNNRMNDKYFITPDYMYESYEKGCIFYENEIYDKCDLCVSHVPLLRLEGTREEETTYYTKLKINPKIIYFFGHTHRNEEVDDFIITEDGRKESVKGYSVGVGYPTIYGRGIGIPHTQTFIYSDNENTLFELR